MATSKKKTSKTTKPGRYSPHPGLGMEERAHRQLREATGMNFDSWVARAKAAGIDRQPELRTWLREEHGIGSRTAWWIASAALGTGTADYEDPESLVDALYSGRHAVKRPLHDALVDALLALGDDVLVTACKTMVPVYRKFVFAELCPVAKGVEVRLALGSTGTGKRLKNATSRADDDRLTHAVVVVKESEIDAELLDWLEAAYATGAMRAQRSTNIEIPDEWAAALKTSKPATATWATCTPAMQRDIVAWFTAAKQQATRDKRIATAIEKLASGARRIY